MAKRKPNHNRQVVEVANNRGVYAVRRKISPESFEVFEDASKALRAEIQGTDRFFKVEDLSVTVVGFKRFNKRLRESGPKTSDMIEQIPSCSEQIVATVGKIGIYGAGSKYKLAFGIESDELINEFAQCSNNYKEAGFPLVPDPNSPDSYTPHCSVALLDQDHVGHFDNRRTISRLDKIAEITNRELILQPVFVH